MFKLNKEDSGNKSFSFFTYIIFIAIFVYIVFKLINIHSSGYITVFNTEEREIKTVVIDAGHGGVDAGKVSGNVLEKDINLSIALILKEELDNLGYNTVMTRVDDDMPSNKQDEMWKRQKIANESDGDIFVSIHQNSSNSSNAKGFQVYYFAKSEESLKLANFIYDSIKNTVNPSTRFEPIENTDYYVLRTTKMPAVLVECGFLSNEGERWLLTTKEYQEKMAIGIAKGIDDYFNR